jgi:hypothetical protein
MKIVGKTGRTIDIKLPGYEGITEVDCTEKEGVLKGILQNDKRLLWKGDDLYTDDLGWHRINLIKRVGPNRYKSTCMERTDTSMMLVPLLGSNQLEMCYSDFFMNAFLFHEDHGQQDGIIWVLMKKPLVVGDIRYTKVIDKLRNSKRCVKEEQLTSTFTLFTMKLPEDFTRDYTMLRLSHFSKLSEEAQHLIFKFHGYLGQPDHSIRLQLAKSPVYKDYLEKKIYGKSGKKLPNDAELRSAIDDERETFKMSYITEDIR